MRYQFFNTIPFYLPFGKAYDTPSPRHPKLSLNQGATMIFTRIFHEEFQTEEEDEWLLSKPWSC